MENFTERHLNAAVVGDATWTAVLLLSYTLLGLLSLTWALVANFDRLGFLAESLVFFFSCKLAKRRGVQAVHECLWALLLVDLVNAISAVFVAARLSSFSCSDVCVRAFGLMVLSKGFMEGLHLLCALVCVLFMHRPHLGTKLQYVALFLAVFLVVFIAFYVFYSEVALCGESIIKCGMAAAIMLTTCYRATVPGKIPVVLVAMFTFFFCLPPQISRSEPEGSFRELGPVGGQFHDLREVSLFRELPTGPGWVPVFLRPEAARQAASTKCRLTSVSDSFRTEPHLSLDLAFSVIHCFCLSFG